MALWKQYIWNWLWTPNIPCNKGKVISKTNDTRSFDKNRVLKIRHFDEEKIVHNENGCMCKYQILIYFMKSCRWLSNNIVI